MVKTAQETQQFRGTGSLPREGAAREANYTSWGGIQSGGQGALEDSRRAFGVSQALLAALADESSRRILNSTIAVGKTVEEMSAEQGLPLSTCYRKVRYLLDEGLMLLERMVVTRMGKRYAVYRASVSEAKIDFSNGVVNVQVTPNPEIVDKLRERWFSESLRMRVQDGIGSAATDKLSRASHNASFPFE